MTRWELFGRGFILPCLVTCNGVVAVRAPLKVAVCAVVVLGFLTSWIWSGSVRALGAACSQPADRFSYALGAAGGSVLGMVVGRLLA
jgi:hypothetical protein